MNIFLFYLIRYFIHEFQFCFSNLNPLCRNLNVSLLLNHIYLFFFLNQATKGCQSLALIGNLMPILVEK